MNDGVDSIKIFGSAGFEVIRYGKFILNFKTGYIGIDSGFDKDKTVTKIASIEEKDGVKTIKFKRSEEQ